MSITINGREWSKEEIYSDTFDPLDQIRRGRFPKISDVGSCIYVRNKKVFLRTASLVEKQEKWVFKGIKLNLLSG